MLPQGEVRKVWTPNFKNIALNAALEVIQLRSVDSLGDSHFIGKVKYEGDSFYLKIRHVVASSDRKIRLNPKKLYFEYRVLKYLGAVKGCLAPSVYGFFQRPATIVLEDLECQGFSPIVKHKDALSDEQVKRLGFRMGCLHTALNKSSTNKGIRKLVTDLTMYETPGHFLIHGDLNTKNILMSETDAKFLDFENCRYGFREHDIGWCLGHILIVDNDLNRCRSLVRALMSEYQNDFSSLNKFQIVEAVSAAIRYRMTAPFGSPFFSSVKLDLADTIAEVSRALMD